MQTQVLYLLARRGAEPEVFLLYRLGISFVKDLKVSLIGEALFAK